MQLSLSISVSVSNPSPIFLSVLPVKLIGSLSWTLVASPHRSVPDSLAGLRECVQCVSPDVLAGYCETKAGATLLYIVTKSPCLPQPSIRRSLCIYMCMYKCLSLHVLKSLHTLQE